MERALRQIGCSSPRHRVWVAALIAAHAATSAPAHAEPPKEDAPPQPSASPNPPQAAAQSALPWRVERNSVPMMITGIALMAVGATSIGIGTGVLIMGKMQCQDEHVDGSTQRVPVGQCQNDSIAVNGGIAAIIGGSTFTAIGIGLTIAGSWKVAVPGQTSALPSLKIGPGSIAFSGSF